jgi:peptidoglycan-N-acetylglucosamine deacetylase
MYPCVTTSWDDGHPLDFKIAELLSKYNLKGTFYIPKTNIENEVMDENAIVRLGSSFEIGGHTLNHLSVNQVSQQVWEEQVTTGYNWLANLLQQPPITFCFPKGQLNKAAATAVFNAGFKLARTTELMNITPITDGHIIPTTIQLYEHQRMTYVKHLLKRKKIGNLLQWLQMNREKDIERMAEKYMTLVIEQKGCFHLWGHSWEIENQQLWKKFELVCKRIANINGVHYIENKELIKQ